MDKMGARRGIIIWSEKMSPAAKKVCCWPHFSSLKRTPADGSGSSKQTLQEMQSEYHLEDFPESDLLVNITKHFLVPKHTVMKPEEKSALIKR